MSASHALAGVAVTAVDFPHADGPTCRHSNACADGTPVGLRSRQLQFNPVSCGFTDIVIEQHRLVSVGLKEVQPAVVIKVTHADAPAIEIVIDTRLPCNILEQRAVQVAKQFLPLMSAPRAITDLGPVVEVAEIDAGCRNHPDQYLNVILGTGRTQSVSHH